MFMRMRRATGALGLVLLSFVCAAPAFADMDQGENENQVEITGVVQAMPASGVIGNWTIAGEKVQTDAATQFDQDDGQIGVGAVVEVKGTPQADGSILAEEIDVKVGVGGPPPGGPGMPGEDEGEFTGPIQSLPAAGLTGTWQIAGRTVQVVSTTTLEQEGGGFAVGAIVEVEGLADANGVIIASKIELVSGGAPGPQPKPEDVEIVGTIDALPASGLIGTWQVAGRAVIVTAATQLDAEDGAFAVGVTVEVEGSLDSSGNLVASQIETKPGSGASEPPLEFFGTINALPGGTSGVLGVWDVGGKLVNVTAQTLIEAEAAPIAIGTVVEVGGWLQADGMIDAQHIDARPQVGAMPGIGPQAVEFFDSQNGHFFLTASTAEITALDGGAFGGAWKRTGQTFNVGGPIVACRFYGMPPRGPDSHFFTIDPTECANVMTQFPAWTFEGHAFSATPAVAGACAAGLLPVHRFFNNPTTAAAINHRFTVTQQAAAQTASMGWIDEGVVMCTQP